MRLWWLDQPKQEPSGIDASRRSSFVCVSVSSQRSVTNAAPHFGHGSLTGRRQTTNLQFGYAEQPKNVRPLRERRSTSWPVQPVSGHAIPSVTGLVVLHSG